MAKKVTRTIISTKVTALCIDLKNAEPYNDAIIIPGSFSVSDKKLEAKAHEFYDNDSRKNCSDSECRTGRKIFWHVRRIIHEVRTGTRRKRHFIDTTEQE